MTALVDPNRGLIELYFRAEVLNAAIEQLESRGAATVRIDAGDWDAEGALPALAEALTFPEHFGGNLDALADCLFDVVSRNVGYPSDTTTKLLAIYQFDSFWARAPQRAGALLEVLYETTITALKLAQPLLVLLQSDDGRLALPPVGAQPIGWNRAEFSAASRR